jgi:hypothetical protein
VLCLSYFWDWTLVAEYPVFVDSLEDTRERFPSYVLSYLKRPDPGFAAGFEAGRYRQDRSFCLQMAAQIADPTNSPFELLDGQRRGLEICRARIEEAFLAANRHRKTVIIIEGPPGSGKSVIAARLWADLMHDPRTAGNGIVLTTTSAAQRCNWEDLFAKAAGRAAGKGVVVPANQYAPQAAAWIAKYRKKHGQSKLVDADAWRDNVQACVEDGALRCPDDAFEVSIVDEAHALLNTEDAKARVGPTGWLNTFGPQAYHIIRASRVSIFLLDADQSFRDRETTRPEDLRRWAAELGATAPETISLAGSQFRVGGAAEYLTWLEHGLDLRVSNFVSTGWRRTAERPDGKFVFEIVPDPLALEEALRPRHAAGESVRLAAAYGRKWKTRGVTDPHLLPAHQQDFDERFSRDGRMQRWSRVWNYAPGQSPDYTLFIQAPSGSRMHDDPLCEVGCPYVVRGFDYSWLGVLWLKDLVWRGDRWRFDLDHVHESGLRLTIAGARKEQKRGEVDGPASRELLLRLKQAYRILLSRAIRGVYVWIEDEETRDYVSAVLRAQCLRIP